MISAVTPTFSSPSHPTASPEVPRDTSSSHVLLGSHVIHPRAPSSRPMPRNPVSCHRQDRRPAVAFSVLLWGELLWHGNISSIASGERGFALELWQTSEGDSTQ